MSKHIDLMPEEQYGFYKVLTARLTPAYVYLTLDNGTTWRVKKIYLHGFPGIVIANTADYSPFQVGMAAQDAMERVLRDGRRVWTKH